MYLIKKIKLSLLLWTVILLIVLRLVVLYFPWKDVIDMAELEKCPACYGITMCPAVIAGSVKFAEVDSLAALINFVADKNVWFGTYGNKKVVIKKLGNNFELQQLDRNLCKSPERSCNVANAVSYVTDDDIGNFMSGLITNGGPVSLPMSYNFCLCPSTIGIYALLQAVKLRNGGISEKTFIQNVWTILHINPEPLLLQVISKEDGWPVPTFYGSCGRIIVEEYIGNTLTSYYNSPWIERAKLAYKLLIAAKNFTYDHPDFRFYLTDPSPDNIAVDDTGNVYFIDMENVIIVDKSGSPFVGHTTWSSSHESQIYDCVHPKKTTTQSCFAFSVDEICNHHISDHNLYAVCQHLLSPKAVPDIMPGGLLHNIPQQVSENYINFSLILTQCGESSEPLGRFKAVDQLLDLLGNIIRTYTSLK